MKWIKMKDQQPPDTYLVLVFSPSVGQFVGEYVGNHTFYVVLTDMAPDWIKDCTHWMPLPDSPNLQQGVS